MRGGLAGVGGGCGGHRYVGSPGKSEWKGPAAHTGGGTIRKSPWLATVFGAKDGRLAAGATNECLPARGAAGVEKDWTMGEPDGADRAKEQP